MTAFEELGVIPQLGDAVSLLGWELPTPIQCEAVPAILGGGDVLIAAETGSGKTGAFCLPVAQIVWEKRKEALSPKTHSNKKTENPKKWGLNVTDRDAGLAIDASHLFCESRAPKVWNGARCHSGLHTAGKYYYEVTIKRDGLCRVGWSTSKATLNLGTDQHGFGFGGTGRKSHNRKFDEYGTSFTTNDVLGCFLDLDNKVIWWSKNGEEFPVAYHVPAHFCDPTNALHPSVLVQCSAVEINLGQTLFKFTPNDKSFIAVSSAPDSRVKWTTNPLLEKRALVPNAPLCIILEPTRELVEQTHNNLKTFASKLDDPPIRNLHLASGVPIQQVLREIESGVDIVTGTPSRVVDLIESEVVSLQNLMFIVIDEADQFLADRQGGARFLERLFAKVPLVAADGSRIQVIVCSATLHNRDINNFADAHMHFPQWIDLKGMDSVAETVHHVVCLVDAVVDKQWIRLYHARDGSALKDDGVHCHDEIRPGTNHKETISLGTKVLKGLYVVKAIRALNIEQAIVFCRTKNQCDDMEAYLKNNGFSATCLHGDRPPAERSRSLAQFKDKTVSFLICTDVAARGIDVSGVPFVINVTLPDDKAVYVHRVGRVGRADRMGLSISLVSVHDEKVWYHKCRSRGIGCENTNDVKAGGCAMWYGEHKLLSDVEEHLGLTIAQVDSDFRIPVDEFDGKIVYGARRTQGAQFCGHATQLASSVAQLADLERSLQNAYLCAITHTYSAFAER